MPNTKVYENIVINVNFYIFIIKNIVFATPKVMAAHFGLPEQQDIVSFLRIF